MESSCTELGCAKKKMKTPPETPGRPYAARELKSMGVVMVLMGLLVAVYFHSVYHYGSAAQMVSTKWGTEPMSAIPPKSPINLVMGATGIGLGVVGLILVAKGMRRKGHIR
jgi:hypothetical protein